MGIIESFVSMFYIRVTKQRISPLDSDINSALKCTLLGN